MEQYYIIIAFTGLLIMISLYGSGITYKYVRATKNRSLGAFALSWLFWSISYGCEICAAIVEYYFPSEEYWKYLIVSCFFFQISGVFSFSLFVDENSKATIGPVKITAISIIGSLYLILPFVTPQLQFSNVSLYIVDGMLWWVQMAFGLLHFLISLTWITRIWKNSPKNTKRVTTTLMLVFTSSSLAAISIYVTNALFDWPMILLYVFHGGARLSIVIAIQIEPRIINILPFVANRVLVINRKSGVLLYEYSWTEEEHKNLSSFIHGMRKVSQETFRVGELKKLNLGEGLVLLDYTENLTFALLTTKSTKYLQLCFKNFKESFVKKAIKGDLKLDGVINSADFEFGDNLVENYFKYIPSRKTM